MVSPAWQPIVRELLQFLIMARIGRSSHEIKSHSISPYLYSLVSVTLASFPESVFQGHSLMVLVKRRHPILLGNFDLPLGNCFHLGETFLQQIFPFFYSTMKQLLIDLNPDRKGSLHNWWPLVFPH